MELIQKYFSDFSPEQLRQFAALEGLYNEWNEKINIISRKDIGGLYEKHVLHSLSIAAVFEFEPGMEIIDIGTGGGFPGIPLAIFFPQTSFHLVDSIAKKLKVVDAVAQAIGLTNISTQHTRAEEIKGRKFDFAVSRAVAPLKELWQWSRPLLKQSTVSGTQSTVHSTQYTVGSTQSAVGRRQSVSPGLICLKGGDLAQEIQESGTRPRVIEIRELFPEPYFSEKFLLFVAR